MHSNRGNRPRPPPGLKGRDIGLFYKNLNKNKQSREREERRTEPGPSVTLPECTLSEIDKLLQKYESESDVTEVCKEFENRFHDLLGKNFHEFVSSKSNSEDLKIADNPAFNEKVKLEFEQQKSHEVYQKRLHARKSLPATQQEDVILNAINNNQIVLIVGSTGCGKTTQIPQFILDHFIETSRGSRCQIVCTQPRRISAITVAERVAYERNENLGKSVGYSIRLQGVYPRPNASILYCTTGTLLRRMETDPLLFELTHIILDEIHERSVETDMLMGLLKKILPYRKEIKVVLMSATVSQSDFQRYFDGCCTIEIEGTLFDVEDRYLEDVLQETGFRHFEAQRKQTRHGRFSKKNDFNKGMEFQSIIEPYARAIRNKYDRHVLDSIRNPNSEEFNLELVENLIFYICERKPPGAILVFLTGFDKISKLNASLQNSRHYRRNNHLIFTLHSSMQTIDQKSVFNRPPNGVRKIILSTNIAETSVTIDDVVYVINCGKIKQTDYDVELNLQTLGEQWVTIANAQQRRGRAGRVQPGICYNLYTRARERLLDAVPSPEIVRSKLEGVLLNLKLLHINDVAGFMRTLLDCPNEKAIELGISLLKRINALDENETITPLGMHLARLPVDPQMGKMILMGTLFRCVDPITTVASAISYKDPFYLPLGKEKQVDAAKKRLSNDTKSDHLMIVNVINEYRRAQQYNAERHFCFDNFVSQSVVSQLERMKKQFCELLEGASFAESSDPRAQELNINSNNYTLLRAVIAAGLYPNMAYIRKLRRSRNRVQPVIQMSTPTDRSVKFHPTSVNSTEPSFDSHYFTYFLKRKSTNVCLLDSTMVFPMALIIFGDGIKCGVNEKGSTFVSVADYLYFKSDPITNQIITRLRTSLGLLLQKKALYPSPIDFNSKDEILISAIKIILSHDEAILLDDEFDEFINGCDDDDEFADD
ncbi:ATP-dependent DNA/RNA helicase DHX36 [Episyrphus balteatus]|uniref:ATP-dependent DNA/RNA helicase DHX36 n=1 Tax=Episyrphus balteatus TaxID=286459 RepID=UPI002486CC59|nr:ATP-dependent DNA/RNA helicase DHX36 [Episyrphus balteatus]